MPDDVFLQHVEAAPDDSDLVILLRRAMAEQCCLPPEMIRDTDECDFLTNKFMLTGWDMCVFPMFLEDNLGVRIDDRVGLEIPVPGGKRKECNTVAGWIRAAIPYIREHIIAPSGPKAPVPRPPDDLSVHA
jgi:hypothetical protein